MDKTENLFPIIFIHKGDQKYLRYSLEQAKRSNPKSQIILIGDRSNNKYDVSHFDIQNFSESANEFTNFYQHLSTQPYLFELFCIQRWFILNEFVQKLGINRFFYADSDVLIFADILKESNKFINYDLALVNGMSGGVSFWFNKDVLNFFCNFIRNIYMKNDIDNYEEIIKLAEDYKKTKRPGGVSDMAFFYLFKKQNLAKIGELTEIIDSSTYDANFSEGQNGQYIFRKRCGVKKIIWRGDYPYGELAEGKFIKFNALHLQGSSKNYIQRILKKKKICSLSAIIKHILLHTQYLKPLLMLLMNIRNYFKKFER